MMPLATPTPSLPAIDPPPASADAVESSSLLFGEPPVAPAGAPTSSPVAAPASSPETSAWDEPVQPLNGVDPFPALADTGDDEELAEDASPVFGSAASMATEILSAAPEVAPTMAGADDPKEVLISEDVTLIARGRRRRFRLH